MEKNKPSGKKERDYRNLIPFKSVFVFELKRPPGTIFTIIALLIAAFSLIATQNHTRDYKQLLRQTQDFKKIEMALSHNFINYRQYGTYGIRVLFLPSPISIFFFNSATIQEFTAYIDSGIRLKIYLSLKGKNLFNISKGNYSDFSGVMIFFGTFLALFFGYDAYNNREFLRFIASAAGEKRVFFAIAAARVLKLSLLLLGVLACAYVIIFLNGVIVPFDGYMLLFYGLTVFHMTFFYFLGASFAAIKSKTTGFFLLLACWYVSLFFAPGIIQSVISRKAANIQPVYELELKKLDLLSKFEKILIKKVGKFEYGKKITKEIKGMILFYFGKDFKKIYLLEKELQDQIRDNILIFQKLSIFLPTTYNHSFAIEISSMGYESLNDFYSYVLKQKEKFVKFYLYKLYFANFSRVIPFEQGKSNVYFSTSRLPGYLIPGVSLHSVYLLLFLTVSFYRFRSSLRGKLPPVKKWENSPREIRLKWGDFKEWVIHDQGFKNFLYKKFLCTGRGKRKNDGPRTIYIDDVDIEHLKKYVDFLCLCHPEHIPANTTALDLWLLMVEPCKRAEKKSAGDLEIWESEAIGKKRFGRLSPRQQGDVLLTILKATDKEVYLLDDIGRGLPVEFHIDLKKQIDELIAKGAIVIFLIGNQLVTDTSRQNDEDFFENHTWSTLVDRFKTHKQKMEGQKKGGIDKS